MKNHRLPRWNQTEETLGAETFYYPQSLQNYHFVCACCTGTMSTARPENNIDDWIDQKASQVHDV